jgi:CRP-like cAMP-binding protein
MLICDTARWALAQFSTEEQEGKNIMLSTIEKVLILKTVNMFSQTPDDVLADVANLLEEMDISENETIFKKGDPGDSMYIIVDGKVRVHTEERLLNYLGESDVFGEMALLDPEPRLASVTTVEPTQLLRLGQSPFYQLMAERPEVATGIIRVLTKLLRDRVRDLSRLDSRVKELEQTSIRNERESIYLYPVKTSSEVFYSRNQKTPSCRLVQWDHLSLRSL